MVRMKRTLLEALLLRILISHDMLSEHLTGLEASLFVLLQRSRQTVLPFHDIFGDSANGVSLELSW